MRKCTKCLKSKPLSEFYKRKDSKSGYKSECKTCYSLRRKEYVSNNKESIEEYNKKYSKKYAKDNSKALCEKSKEWRKNNRKRKAKATTDYYNKRRKNDESFRILTNLRSRLYRAFKATSLDKNINTKTLLGCTSKELKQYLEDKFIDNMSWENYGEWHIDHIIPLSSANSNEELEKLCHYSNLQPLWALDNIKKGNRKPYTE